MSEPYFYLQRAGHVGWVHFCHDGVAHVTTKSWRLWLLALMKGRG